MNRQLKEVSSFINAMNLIEDFETFREKMNYSGISVFDNTTASARAVGEPLEETSGGYASNEKPNAPLGSNPPDGGDD